MAQRKSRENRKGESGSILNRRKILLIGDQDKDRESLVEALETEYELLYAESSQIGLELFSMQASQLSLVMIDTSLPAGTGYEFLEQVGKRPNLRGIPVMAIVTYGQFEEENRCLALGAVECLSKPFHKELIQRKVRMEIARKETADNQMLIERDLLTGLYTMPAFTYYAAERIKSTDTAYNMICIMLSEFKQMNTVLGNRKGDEVLQSVAQELQKQYNQPLLARDGVKFFMLYTKEDELPKDEFISLWESIKEHCDLRRLRVKCGVYSNLDKTLPVASLCDRVLLTVNSIRDSEETAFASYDENLQKLQQEEQELERRFEEALRLKEFAVWFQPKVEPGSERIVAAEALTRWILPDRKILMPGKFIPILERDGRIGLLDRYVFQTVCEFQKGRLLEGKRVVPISVNLSGTSFYQTEHVETYVQIITEVGIPKELVPIELIVPPMMRTSDMRELIAEFHRFGFVLHLDDFTSGSSSFSLISQMPLDVLKIDKSQIDCIGTEKGNAWIRHIVSYAQETGMQVVAEGVESQEQIELLKAVGCDQIQGYYFATPKDAEIFQLILDSTE